VIARLVIQKLKSMWMLIKYVHGCFILQLKFEMCLFCLYDAFFPNYLCISMFDTSKMKSVQIIFKVWVTALTRTVSPLKTSKAKLLICCYWQQHAKQTHSAHTCYIFKSEIWYYI
jgi:hypothetical protein